VAEFIEKEKLVAGLDKTLKNIPSFPSDPIGRELVALGIETVIKTVKALPAADVVPVVLCRDCKYGQGEKMDFWGEYEGIECIGGVVHRKDWFCADGEKREES
jgi:hypothetical protein